LGFLLGCGAHMQELRRTRSGAMKEDKTMVTLHQVLDAQTLWEQKKIENELRKVIQPLENLLVGMKRIIVKDSSVNAITYGAKLMVPGLLRFDEDVQLWETVVLITTKGEAIALGIAYMSATDMANCDHGCVAKVKRCIMQRDWYPRRWGLGPVAQFKKGLKAKGKLDVSISHSTMFTANCAEIWPSK
jgi:H/ACA ribonucleoprotein complex subunit 4